MVLTTETLLYEMVDLSRMAEFPNPPYRCWQASSFDRGSIAPDKPGWFANADAGNFLSIHEENGIAEAVLLDASGPGCLVRIWSANPTGELRLYIDDLSHPVLEADFAALVAGDGPIPAPFAIECSRGKNLYFPFLFSRRCRVTVVGETAQVRRLYYHINCRTFSGDTQVQSFSSSDFVNFASAIKKVRHHLASNTPLSPLTDSACSEFSQTIKPGERSLLCYLSGPKAISELSLRIGAEDIPYSLQHTVLQIRFDESPSPQVDSPVGSFFGCGPGLAPYSTLAFSVDTDGEMVCRLPMPFGCNASIFLWNRGSQDADVAGYVLARHYDFGAESMHLRAKWRVDHDIRAASTREPSWPIGLFPMYDWPYIILHGQGTYVGTSLSILNPTSITTLNWGWWGEGDEKIYVDGESFPSTYGTGSEDYFGYGWSRPELFEHPYIAQPRCDGPGNRGITVNNRWHVLDAIPFKKSLEFCMELSHHTATPGISYGRLSYVYALPGARDDHTQITDRDLHFPEAPAWKVEVPPHLTASHTLLEGEDASTAPTGDMVKDVRFSGGAARFWSLGPDDEIRLDLTLETEKLWLALGCKASPDAEDLIVSLWSTDADSSSVAEAAIPLHSVTERMLEIALSDRPLLLKQGDYQLRFRFANGKTKGMGHFVLDYVRWLDMSH